MDQNLDDSLTLETSMGVDFEHPTTDVAQEDISLDVSGHGEGMTMEFENIEEQPTLMDTGSEEIIGHDFMEDQFGLQEYSITDDQITTETTVQSDDVNLHGVTLQDDPQMFSSNTLDIQYTLGQEIMSIPASGQIQISAQETLPKVVSVQGTPQFSQITSKKGIVSLQKPQRIVQRAPTTPPKQVAIAPKPPKLAPAKAQPTMFGQKQYQIRPKPMTVVSKTPVSFVKKITVPSGTVKTTKLTNLAQLSKQIVMVPGSTQKYKLVPAGSSIRLVASEGSSQPTPQLISATAPKNMKSVKVILQGQNTGEGQQKILTKFLQTGTGTTPARYVTMQTKTVPITNKSVIMASPTKDGIKYVQKKHPIFAIKSPTKIAPAGSANTQGATTKKVIISANPSQNIVLKTSGPSKTSQITSVTAGQKSQLHQINVPGKGIQYIRLLTNPTSSHSTAPVRVTKPITVSSTTKTFILSKDDVIELTEKGNDPPPLVVTSSAAKNVTKPQHKLVRIAPITNKQTIMPQPRSGQSLLAPISPTPSQKITLEDVQNLLEAKAEMDKDDSISDNIGHEEHREEEVDSKSALRALIADAVGEDMVNDESNNSMGFDTSQDSSHHKNNSEEMDDSEHPLIIIPPYNRNDSQQQDERRMSTMVNIEVDPMNLFDSRTSFRDFENENASANGLGMSVNMSRARKPCNCTKSQCLKLYCDCFANGEFCNQCNCNNCYNNLENEEMRQKAIKGCLDRNPNAFRPKIGKSKTGGPEIIRRHNKGCNCKRSGCLKNYCECYEAKIACSAICKCVGCRNVEDGVQRRSPRPRLPPRPPVLQLKQPSTFMTMEVISAVCQCLFAAAVEAVEAAEGSEPVRCVIEEFSRCLHDVISAAQHAQAQA